MGDRDVVTVVTGGASGIGLATACALLEADPAGHVAVVDISTGGVDGLEGKAPGRVHFHRCDVSDEAQVAACADAISAVYDVCGLVNSAGIVIAATPSEELSLGDFRRVLGVHLEGALLWNQAVGRVWMRDGRAGAIVNVGSVAGRFGWPGRLAYGAAKLAVESMTRTLAVEWAPHGIRVNAVCPGYVDTPLMDAAQRPVGLPTLAEAARRHALGRVAKPKEVAAAIAFLLSNGASFITGEVVVIDGGFSVMKS